MSALRARIAALLGLAAPVPTRKLTRDAAIVWLPPPATVRLPVAGLDLAVATGELVAAHALVARSPATARWQRRVHTPLGGRVEVVDGSDTSTIEVMPGLTAGGLVEVTPAEEGELEEGDEVVVGSADGSPISTPEGDASTDARG